jgi:hypothetical protein
MHRIKRKKPKLSNTPVALILVLLVKAPAMTEGLTLGPVVYLEPDIQGW